MKLTKMALISFMRRLKPLRSSTRRRKKRETKSFISRKMTAPISMKSFRLDLRKTSWKTMICELTFKLIFHKIYVP